MSEQLYLARKTIIEMLEDRGYKNKFIKNYAYSIFNEMYKSFTNYSGVFDLEASNNESHKTIVKFIKTINSKSPNDMGIRDPSQSTAAKKEILDIYSFIKDTFLLEKGDTVIFIICYGDDLHDVHKNLDKRDEDLQIFHMNRLISNITRHVLVPKHELLNKDEKLEIKKEFKLPSLDKLPHILDTDPIAKYYNMRHGDVCKIYRPSKNAGLHICYRYCHEDYSSDIF